MSEAPTKGLKVVELVPGSPEKCPRCAGWGYVGGPTKSERHACPECKGQRTMRLAKVHGYMLVPVETELGEDFRV